MSLRRHQIFGAVKDLLSAAPYLQGVPVISDDGRRENTKAQEDALLTGHGVVIAIPPILREVPDEHSPSGYMTRAQFGIHLRTNPERRGTSGFDPDLGVEAIQYAMLGQPAVHPNLRFRPIAPGVTHLDADEPNLTHVLFFEVPVGVFPPAHEEHTPPPLP